MKRRRRLARARRPVYSLNGTRLPPAVASQNQYHCPCRAQAAVVVKHHLSFNLSSSTSKRIRVVLVPRLQPLRSNSHPPIKTLDHGSPSKPNPTCQILNSATSNHIALHLHCSHLALAFPFTIMLLPRTNKDRCLSALYPLLLDPIFSTFRDITVIVGNHAIALDVPPIPTMLP